MTDSSARTLRQRITWEQFARAAKFLVGLVWGTMELWLWGGRAVPLAFIGAIIAGTEATQAWLKIRALAE